MKSFYLLPAALIQKKKSDPKQAYYLTGHALFIPLLIFVPQIKLSTTTGKFEKDKKKCISLQKYCHCNPPQQLPKSKNKIIRIKGILLFKLLK